MKTGRRRMLGMAAIALIACSAPWVSFAQTAMGGGAEGFPSKPIRVIVAFPPGAGADLTARVVAQKMSDSMGQPVVVENRPGANGSLAASVVAKAPADGYTLLLIDRGGLGINPSLYKSLAYDPVKDFAHVSIATWGPYVIVASSKLPVKTFQDFVQLAKTKPASLNYASFGVGSMAQLNMEALNTHAGIKLTHVPYKGGAPAATAVAAGEADVTVATAPGVLGFIQEGKMRPLAISSTRRSPLLPDVPTLVEVGIPSDVLLPTYFGFVAPAGTPAAVVNLLSAEIKKAVSAPDVVERLTKAGLEPYGSSPEEMAQTVRTDVTRFAKLVSAIGIQPE